MGRVEGKVAIITGAASGMGRVAAELFAKEGAKVVATDIQEELLKEVVDGIVAAGGQALGVVHDVTDRSQWEKVMKETKDKFGPVNILVNNAGISMPKTFLELNQGDWDKVLKINVDSVFHGCQLACVEMIANGGGSIVNIASMASLVGNSGAGPYTASKGAVRALSKALAVDMAKSNIRVNTIHPGYIRTEMSEALFQNDDYRGFFEANTPLPFHGKPEHIAQGILFLGSDESAFITGVDLPIDGGVTAQ